MQRVFPFVSIAAFIPFILLAACVQDPGNTAPETRNIADDETASYSVRGDTLCISRANAGSCDVMVLLPENSGDRMEPLDPDWVEMVLAGCLADSGDHGDAPAHSFPLQLVIEDLSKDGLPATCAAGLPSPSAQ